MLFSLLVVKATHCILVHVLLPQCCHGVAKLVYDAAEQQGDEEVGQLTGWQIDTRNLKTQQTAKMKKTTT